MEEAKTTISIFVSDKKRLDDLKLVKQESYCNLLKRVLDEHGAKGKKNRPAR